MVMKPSAEIDISRLEREAGASEHGEAYRAMGRLGDVRIGVGARHLAPDETVFFIEVVVPFTSGPRADLEELEKRLRTLRRLEEGGFTPTLQEDGDFVCELPSRGEDLQGEYERTLTLIGAR